MPIYRIRTRFEIVQDVLAHSKEEAANAFVQTLIECSKVGGFDYDIIGETPDEHITDSDRRRINIDVT